MADGGLDRWQGTYIASMITTGRQCHYVRYGRKELYKGVLVATLGQRRRDDGFTEVFAHGAHRLGHAHAGFRGLRGFDDGRSVELVFDLDDLGETCYLVCLGRRSARVRAEGTERSP